MSIIYTPASKRLSLSEEQLLVDNNLLKNFNLPIEVRDDYSFYSFNDEVLYLGRNALYERVAMCNLRNPVKIKTKLRGLYFPTATPSLELLCQATLYFDEFFIIHPGSPLLSNINKRSDLKQWIGKGKSEDNDKGYKDHYNQFVERLESFDNLAIELKEAGILNAIPPMMQENPNFIKLITSDLNNEDFLNIANVKWENPVFIAATKFEPLLPLIGDSKSLTEVRDELNYRATYPNFSNAKREELFFSLQGVKEVNPVLAASILLNHAYLLSENFNLVPFTDDSFSIKLLNAKLKQLSQKAGFIDYKKQLNLTSSTLAIRVLEEYLPKFKFKTIYDALQARLKLHDQLLEFRDAMRAFATEVTESPFDDKFQLRVEGIVASKIKPAVKELELKITKSKDDFLSKILANSRIGALPIAASIFAGLPAEAVIAISAGILTFSAAIETYREQKRNKTNGLTILLGE